MPDTRQSFKLESAGALTVGTGKDRWVAPFPGQVISASAVVGTAPTGAALIVDLVNTTQANASVFGSGTKPTVAISGTSGAADADQTVSRFNKGDVLRLDVTQIGSTVAGSDLDLVVQYLSV